jgi:hypothetical protein
MGNISGCSPKLVRRRDDQRAVAKDIRATLDAGEIVWAHSFERACAKADIDHRPTKPLRPWTKAPIDCHERP